MISIDATSSSSSSLNQEHKQLLSHSDLNLSDENNQLPNFSLRDYVFGVRSKDISCNWPFSPTSLQLCLKHGVKNLLPPFQSLDSLRNNSSLTRCSLENGLTDDKLITSFDGNPKNDQFSLNDKIVIESVAIKSSALKGDQDKTQFHLRRQPKLKKKDKPQKPENASSIGTIIKKSRFVSKLNSGVEHAAPNFVTMTSKVCPVCKIFSSSSNTTLNAHIDQCLTGEGTLKWTENPKVDVVIKHRVKPRKMRIMGDIYKTAPHCTIEELDKRNGTSWATNSSFPAQEFHFQDEEVEEKEEEEPKRSTVNPEVANYEGDVYIDTNGTKVRILSVPRTGSSDNHGGRKLLKEVKRSKIIMVKKNKDIFKKKNHHKYLKLGPNAEKFCSPKSQAKSGKEDDLAMKVADLGLIRPPWACSKRTGLSKKYSGKNRKVDIHSRESKDLVVESEKSSSRCDLRTPQCPSDNNGDSSQNKKKMKISLSLIKKPLNRMAELRKEDTHMHDDDDDDDEKDDDDDDDGFLDAYPSPHSDGAETRSKSSKFSSLTKNLSFPAAKLNLKRKFSVVENHFNEKSPNGESDVGIETVNQDELPDVESVRNETLLSNVVTAPSFIGLSTSFNPQLSKQECDELYQAQICLTNRAPNDVEILESYRQEVDPIPIPGPPGSFLPASPGGEMVSEEEIQPVTVLLSENQTQHHFDHTTDRDSMSSSPVSTVSNSRSTSVQDNASKKPYFSGDTTEKGSSHNTFKNDHQPCCCSRKEVTLNYQDSYILRKQQFKFKSEMFPSSNYITSPAPDTANFPTHKKFPVSSGCNSPTGSPSKPVLRLMGKNLTVDKTYGDEFRPPQSSQPYPQQNVIFSQYQNGYQSQQFNVYPPSNMRSPVDLMPIRDGFMGFVDHYAHGSPYLGPSMPQTRSHHGHNVLDSQTINGRNVYSAASSSKPINELIVIDDSPESEAVDSMLSESFKRSHRQMNPSHTMYPPYRGGGSAVSSGFRGGSFQTSLGNEDFGKWNIRSPSPSTSYYPPNYL